MKKGQKQIFFKSNESENNYKSEKRGEFKMHFAKKLK